MGIFDYVVGVPEIKCRKCGQLLTDWQTKHEFSQLRKIHWSRVERFYTCCDNCKEWHEFRRGDEFSLSDTEDVTAPLSSIKFEDYKLK